MSLRRRFSNPARKEPREAIRSLERDYPTDDPVARKLGAPSHYGSIQAIEEKRFPWLRQRRGR